MKESMVSPAIAKALDKTNQVLSNMHNNGALSNVDCNAYTQNMTYRIGNVATLTNAPSGIGSTGVFKIDAYGGFILQHMDLNLGSAFRYSFDSGNTWTDWNVLALKSEITSVEGGVPVRRVGIIENNGSVALRVSNQFSSNADFALVCLNISGSATLGYALLALGKGASKYKDLVGVMSTSYYECSFSNGTWTITNKSGSDMFYTALLSSVG